MRTIHTCGVIGGDLRSVFLARALLRAGFTVAVCGLEGAELPAGVTACAAPAQAVPMMDAVILPLPVTADGVHIHAPLARGPMRLDEVLQAATPDQLLCGGQIPPEIAALATQRGLRLEDYGRQEELAVFNAVPAAEGAIQLAMEELPVTISGSRCTVTGCGRVGRALATRLAALGARVTVVARDCADRAWAIGNGYAAEPPERLTELPPGDVIFNTVPACLFNGEVLRHIGSRTLLIDLASKPGGVDWDAAAMLRCRTIWALSLPGRVAPETAGEILARTVLHLAGM